MKYLVGMPAGHSLREPGGVRKVSGVCISLCTRLPVRTMAHEAHITSAHVILSARSMPTAPSSCEKAEVPPSVHVLRQETPACRNAGTHGTLPMLAQPKTPIQQAKRHEPYSMIGYIMQGGELAWG